MRGLYTDWIIRYQNYHTVTTATFPEDTAMIMVGKNEETYSVELQQDCDPVPNGQRSGK